jgi:hypothetical protein
MKKIIRFLVAILPFLLVMFSWPLCAGVAAMIVWLQDKPDWEMWKDDFCRDLPFINWIRFR